MLTQNYPTWVGLGERPILLLCPVSFFLSGGQDDLTVLEWRVESSGRDPSTFVNSLAAHLLKSRK